MVGNVYGNVVVGFQVSLFVVLGVMQFGGNIVYFVFFEVGGDGGCYCQVRLGVCCDV